MKPELKKRWTDALRSGEYTKTMNALGDGKGFCCLGVACEVFREDVRLTVSREGAGMEYTSYNCCQDILPQVLAEYLEISITGELPWPVEGKRMREGVEVTYAAPNLIEVNDSLQYTFTQIADIIDEQF